MRLENKHMQMTIRDYLVAIIGAGPVGLAAAAHLVSRKIPFIIFESGVSVGTNLQDWGHVQTFSSWKYNMDQAAKRLLEETGWQCPSEDSLPTGEEIVRDYLHPLSAHIKIQPFLHLSARVISITRRSINKMETQNRDQFPFLLRVNVKGSIQEYLTSTVIDVSGTWQNPNPISTDGVFTQGELERAAHIQYRIPDITGTEAYRYAGKRVAVVGSGHSAFHSLQSLVKLKAQYPKTDIIWIMKGNQGSLNKRILPKKIACTIGSKKSRGMDPVLRKVGSGVIELYSSFRTIGLDGADTLTIHGLRGNEIQRIDRLDEVIVNTGSRPDFAMHREIHVETDAVLECTTGLTELIYPSVHTCGTVPVHGEAELRQPEPNFYIVGSKSFGRASNFLMAIGYEQVKSVVRGIDSDLKANYNVEYACGTNVCSPEQCH